MWMIKRIIDISERAYLHIKDRQLLVDKENVTVSTIAIEDLGILILQHPAITITQSAITLCQQSNVAILFCDERHLPVSITLPLWSGHSLHTKVLREQVATKVPRRKRLWQQIVRAKISEQADTLDRIGLKSQVLARLHDKVRSGDPDNIEAQAAQVYWKALMGKSFRRDVAAEGVNSMLNYGYSIMRAMIARALVGTGLHPSIGLHHKNQYNGLCLADDVMEPLRPWVDSLVREIDTRSGEAKITRDVKQQILSLLSKQVSYGSEKMPLMLSAHYLAAQVKQAMSDSSIALHYPRRY
jgi:CRISP-associated protein Cas1